MTVATWSDWRAAVGSDVPVEQRGTWTVRSCSDGRTSSGWATWDVTFRAPVGTGQVMVVLDLPGVGPQALLAVPSAAEPDGTLLVATFVVPDDAPRGPDDTLAGPAAPTHPTTDGTTGPVADAGTEA